MTLSNILILILVFIFGVIITFLWTNFRYQKKVATASESGMKQQKVLSEKEEKILQLEKEISALSVEHRHSSSALEQEKKANEQLEKTLRQAENELQRNIQTAQEQRLRNEVLTGNLENQKKELEQLQQKMNTTFENLANKIFEQKTENFTKLNQENLKPLLEPLNKNLAEFKAKVEEVYVQEAKARFSLGEKVKELAELNKEISKEAQNLTTALKGNAKTQGRWGEMILENILEKSGLNKGQEYFMEYQLEDESGTALRSSDSGKKMRPDAIVKYPGNRSIIIDSKVSLNAYSRYIAASEESEKRAELSNHVTAVKNHILTLSRRGYDDYASSLDFVMMFIPSESAYMAAIQADSDLWNFAYDKRILLLSPANLITALKLVVDLWKREHQDRNALQIAEQGGKLYDKFVGFVESFQSMGDALSKAQNQFDLAGKRLFSGRDNLIRQAEKLKALGLKTKKELPPEDKDSATGAL